MKVLSTLNVPPAKVSADLHRILIAISGESRLRFESQFDSQLFSGHVHQWIDFSSASKQTWQNTLEEFAPTILMTGWETPPIPESLASSERFPLRYLCHLMGTVRNIVPRVLLERGVLVSNWGRHVAPAVAEHSLLLLLAGMRNVPAWGEALINWPKGGYGAIDLGVRSLRGRRIGVHGFGAVAREAVPLLHAFGAQVAAYSPGVPEAHFIEYGVTQCKTLNELFSGSDAVIECEALNEQSRGAVTERLLRLLPPGAVFVNVGRGAIVDEGALVRLAREGRLRVALDVFSAEPLASDSELRNLPGVFLSPHIAGPTQDGFFAIFRAAMENIRRFVDGDEIDGRVTLEAYDRAT